MNDENKNMILDAVENKVVGSGHFNLFKLLDFAADNPQMFGEGKKRGKYNKEVSSLLGAVPVGHGGWYFWGRFNDMGWWETTYLGMTTKGKTASLSGRLTEELQDERIFLWASVYGRESAMKQHKRRYKGRYYDQTRSLRKIGAYFVIWVAADDDISPQEIKRQEAILIGIFRPTHNVQRGHSVEPSVLTKKIEQAIGRELEKILAVNSSQ